jgi:hypothetical protein
LQKYSDVEHLSQCIGALSHTWRDLSYFSLVIVHALLFQVGFQYVLFTHICAARISITSAIPVSSSSIYSNTITTTSEYPVSLPTSSVKRYDITILTKPAKPAKRQDARTLPPSMLEPKSLLFRQANPGSRRNQADISERVRSRGICYKCSRGGNLTIYQV